MSASPRRKRTGPELSHALGPVRLFDNGWRITLNLCCHWGYARFSRVAKLGSRGRKTGCNLLCGKELDIVEQCFSGGVRKQVSENACCFANLLFHKDLQQKGPAYGGPLGAVLPPLDAEPFSATCGLMRPEGACISDAGLRLPKTARGITLPIGPIPPALCDAVADRTGPILCHCCARIPHSVRRNPPLGPPLRRTLRQERPPHAVPHTPPHLRAVLRAKVSVSPIAHARQVAGLTTPVYHPYSGLLFGLTLPTGPCL